LVSVDARLRPADCVSRDSSERERATVPEPVNPENMQRDQIPRLKTIIVFVF